MPCTKDDPRAQLAAAPAPAPAGESLPLQTFVFSVLDPDVVSSSGSRSWIVRAMNVVFVLTELERGDVLTRDDPDETFAVVLATDGAVSFEAGGTRSEVADAETAGRFVASTRFPPRGIRGSGETSRAGGWGRVPRAEYMSRTRLPVGQIESTSAVGVGAVARAHDEDYDFIVCGNDITTLANGAEDLIAAVHRLSRTTGPEFEEHLT